MCPFPLATRVRTQAIKFLEALVLLQTYTEPDSITREGEFNLDHVPLTLKVARPRKLEEEARYVSMGQSSQVTKPL